MDTVISPRWYRLFVEGHKVLYCPDELLQPLDAELQALNLSYVIDDPELAEEAFVDMPGMVLIDRPYWTTTLAGYNLRIPVEDFFTFLHQAQDGNPAQQGAQRWVLSGWLQVVILTRQMRDELLANMLASRDAIEAQAAIEATRYMKAMDIINQHPNVKVAADKVPMSPVKSDEWN